MSFTQRSNSPAVVACIHVGSTYVIRVDMLLQVARISGRSQRGLCRVVTPLLRRNGDQWGLVAEYIPASNYVLVTVY